MNRFFYVFVFLCPVIFFGQKTLTRAQIMEDYTVLKSILEQGHPNLYAYTSKDKWSRLFDDFEKEKIKTIKNNNDLYKQFTKLTDFVRDGHLIVMRPKLDTIPKLFPLWLKIINNRLYTDTDDFDIPIGSEIISIDEVKGEDLRKILMQYAPTDGYNTSKKDRQVEREFGILHFYEFGAKPTYQIVYKTPYKQLISKRIKSKYFESIGQQFVKRSSYLAHKTIGQKEPFLYFIDSLNTAVLTINTFGIKQQQFSSNVKRLFKKIKQKKAKHLIIDIRQNDGGYPDNSNYTFSYIAKQSFIQPKSQHVKTSSLPEKKFSKEIVNGYTYQTFFKKFFQNGLKKENQWVVFSPEENASMVPIKNKFKGQVYVLIGGKTFSAGSTFALNCKNQEILLFGEETGGGYYLQTGGYPVIYELPNSEIKIMMSFVKFKKNVIDKTVKKGTGVSPDFKIQLTPTDLIETKDASLDYILRKINK